MKIVGTKYEGLESGICYFDHDKEELFALQSDRVSRIKKDNLDIDQLLNYIKKKKIIQDNIDIVSIPFSNFNGDDAILGMQCPTYFWLKKEKIKRSVIKPKYYKDLLEKIPLRKKLIYFLNPYWLIFSLAYIILSKFRTFKILNSFFIKLTIRDIFKKNGLNVKRLNFFDHHTCHAASAIIHHNFKLNKDNFIFITDEHGDKKHASFFKWDKNRLNLLSSSKINKIYENGQVYVTSIGNLYSNFTVALGLRRSTDEGKVEALAAYGKPDKKTLDLLHSIIKIDYRTLKFEIDSQLYKKFLTVNNLKKILGEVGDKNFASTIQNFLEVIIIDFLQAAKEKYNFQEIFVAGGVFANVILSYKIYEQLKLSKINVIPYMGDEGSAMGAAVLSSLKEGKSLNNFRKIVMPYIGTKFDKNETLLALNDFEGRINYVYLEKQMAVEASKSLIENKIICTFLDKMEFGPRALGNRSILANPFFKETRDKINSEIKRRPWYQPLCPTILEEDREEIFERSFNHKYMSTAFKAHEKFKTIIPSALHVDLTARPQFVDKSDNLFIFSILKKIKEKFKYGVILNTSFNLHGRTNVLTPKDAIVDFIDCNLDELYINGFKVTKKK